MSAAIQIKVGPVYNLGDLTTESDFGSLEFIKLKETTLASGNLCVGTILEKKSAENEFKVAPKAGVTSGSRVVILAENIEFTQNTEKTVRAIAMGPKMVLEHVLKAAFLSCVPSVSESDWSGFFTKAKAELIKAAIKVISK